MIINKILVFKYLDGAPYEGFVGFTLIPDILSRLSARNDQSRILKAILVKVPLYIYKSDLNGAFFMTFFPQELWITY